MMHMTMYWGIDLTLLFDWWKTDSWASYALALFVCFLFAAFYQYMEDRRIQFKSIAAAAAIDDPSQPLSGRGTPLLLQLRRTHNPRRLVTAALFGLNSAIGYLLMLAIMSFNGGVLVAVVLGLSVGYYFFRCADEEDRTVVVDNSCACS